VCAARARASAGGTAAVGKTAQVHAETVVLLVLGAVAVIVGVRWVAGRTGLPAAALLTLALRVLERELDHEEGLLPARGPR
jgi:hypothetical protein